MGLILQNFEAMTDSNARFGRLMVKDHSDLPGLTQRCAAEIENFLSAFDAKVCCRRLCAAEIEKFLSAFDSI